MVNTEEFTIRLKELLEYFNESASGFSEKIEVQRSNISHIMSGRNKPSLDFILKILKAYPDINLYWLLNGKGNMIKNLPNNREAPTLFENNENQKLIDGNLNALNDATSGDSKIERIVVFFSDGTFKNYICNKNE